MDMNDDKLIQIEALKSNYAVYIEALNREMEKIRSQRSILFTGMFKSGTSTLINALIGKDTLKTAAPPTTANIARIMFGRDEEKVTVFYNDKHPKGVHTKEITIEEYRLYYHLRNDKLDIDTIDHVEIELRTSIPDNSIQFIDSTGVIYPTKESEITRIYEQKASAVVFLINATMPCNTNEQDRIAVKYYNRHLKNVFFVITRMDCLGSEDAVKEVKKRTKAVLHDVFINEYNRFDEELFKKRVFYVNALGAVNAKTGRNSVMYLGGKAINIPITIDETGIPEFEKALYECVKTPGKEAEADIRNIKIKLNIVEPKYRELCNEKEMTDFKLKYYQEFYYNIIKSM